MIANFLPYVLHFVHRGRKFASSTALYPTHCVPYGTSLNVGRAKAVRAARATVAAPPAMVAPVPAAPV